MLIASTIFACTTIWAVAASIMAYNRGREVDDMVGRHHSVVDQLTATRVELDNAKREHRTKERELERTYLAELDKVANLTDDIEGWKGLYTSALNRANRLEAMHARMTTRNRDPKTGRIVKAEQPKTHMRGEDPALAAFDTMMDNAIDQLKGLTVRTICDEVKANAGKGI